MNIGGCWPMSAPSENQAVLELFLQTGLRLSEPVNLTVTDLELSRRLTKDPENVGMIRVQRKRGREVYLPLNWKACEALSAWLTARRGLIGLAAPMTPCFSPSIAGA